MIKIFIKDEKKICDNHFEKSYKFCQNKIEFLEVFSEYLDGKKNLSDLSNFKEIQGNTKNALIRLFLNKKINGDLLKNKNLKKHIKKLYVKNSKDLVSFFKYLKGKNVLEKIFKTRSSGLEELEKKVFEELNNVNKEELKEILKSIFSYTYFTGSSNIAYNDYELSKRLDINVCPYCNRLYTNTVINSGLQIIRPTFDHFYNKDTHPLFSISFYNLIPSCSICNTSLKGKKSFSYNTHLNPYEQGFDNNANFYIEKIDDSCLDNLIEINIKNKTDNIKIKNNKEVFQLKEIYQASHIDIVKDLAKKLKNDVYDTLFTNNTISTLGLTRKKDLYNLYISNLYDTEDFQNRPLSKFTKDIFDDLLSKGYAKELNKLP